MNELAAYKRALEICVFCPKLCRYACPVAEAEARETVTPWGIMTRLDDVSRGAAPFDEQMGELLAHCTGCDRCTQMCKHDNPVAEVIRAGRAVAARLGVLPPALLAWAETPAPEPKALTAYPIERPTLILAGYTDPAVVEASISLLEAAGYTVGRPRDGITTSGVRWLHAGRPEAFQAQLALLAGATEGAETLVCLDADDAWALRTYGHLNFDVVHLAEALDGRLSGLKPVYSGDVLYLDDSRLGRGLGVVDAPRALLAQIVDGTIREALMSGVEGGCCGAGAGYAACVPEGAKRVAIEALADVPEVPIISAGSHCVEHLRAHAEDRPVDHWAVRLADGLRSKR